MEHFHSQLQHVSSEHPQTGMFLTIIFAVVSIFNATINLFQGVDLVFGIIAKLVAIGAGLASILVCWHTIKSKGK